MVFEGMAGFAMRERLALVVLFGSRSRGQERAQSDFDLALLPLDPLLSREGVETRLVQQWERSDLDLLWLPHASPLAKARVATEGVLLFEDQPYRFRHFAQSASLGKSESRFWAQADQRFVERSIERNWDMDRDFVLRKLAQLADYIEQLEAVMDVDEARFARDFRVHRVAERQIELLVECAAKLGSGRALSITITSTRRCF